MLEAADANPNSPYFVVLDEMNLARVEYYFSDFLSVIESRKWKDGKIVTSPVLPESITNKHITIPSNVYIIGTVNMDETTHPYFQKRNGRLPTVTQNQIRCSLLRKRERTININTFLMRNTELILLKGLIIKRSMVLLAQWKKTLIQCTATEMH